MVAGQVELDEVSVDITLGFNAIGNSSHIPLALDDFLFDQLNDGDEIQFFGPDGRSSETIFWYTEDGQWGGFVPDGWYDGSLNPVGASTIREPGEGFFLYTTSSGASFKVPALTLN